MIRGLYSAASGMFAGQRRQEVLTNNLINAHTVGYKQDDAISRSFPEMLIARIREHEGPMTPKGIPGRRGTVLGPLSGSVYTHEIAPSFLQGLVQQTDRPLDFAIEDAHFYAPDPTDPNNNPIKYTLFFSVQDKNGNVYYTRDGRWTTDAYGQLTTQQGDLVLGVNAQGEPEPIRINGESFQVDEKGNYHYFDNDGNLVLGRLYLAAVSDPNQMVKSHHGYFEWTGTEEIEDINIKFANNIDEGYTIFQGAVENSNVDVTKVMTQMIEVLRFYEANQKVLQATDRTLEKAVNEIGKV